MKMLELLSQRFLRHLLATPRGQAHLLNQLAQAENSDEGQIFEYLLAGVNDPELHRMIQRHYNDEQRHAVMFLECVARTGYQPHAVPPELKVLDRLDQAMGGFMKKPISQPEDIMKAYLLLQVIEERAVSEFASFQKAFRKCDPKTAEVLAQIEQDEKRHLKYCHAIARRYAPSEARREQTLQEMRKLEARIFGEVRRANMRYMLDNHIVSLSRWQELGWRSLLHFSSGLASREHAKYQCSNQKYDRGCQESAPFPSATR